MMIRSQIQTRSLTTSARNLSWFGDLFGKNKETVESKKKREEIIEQQDDLTTKGVKITHLTYKNSQKYEKFNREKEMPGYSIKAWRRRNGVDPKHYETYFASKSKLHQRIGAAITPVVGKFVRHQDYEKLDLRDLEFRFKIVKALQTSLGLEINDYMVSRSHNLQILVQAIEDTVNIRWKEERNPDAIALRQGDFSSGNVYLNTERTDKEKQVEFNKLVQKMKVSEKQAAATVAASSESEIVSEEKQATV